LTTTLVERPLFREMPMTITDSERDARPKPRQASDKAALKYLEVSGVNAISITTGPGGIVLGIGYRANAVAAFWLSAGKARAVAAKARSIAGDAVDVEAVVAALHEAATQCRAVLTEHHVAMARAHVAAERLDAIMEILRDMGALKEFRRTYKRRRLAAKERGQGYMTFANAELRLKRALIPLIQSGGKPAAQSIFAEVFGA
jgi:hypothetical protein